VNERATRHLGKQGSRLAREAGVPKRREPLPRRRPCPTTNNRARRFALRSQLSGSTGPETSFGNQGSRDFSTMESPIRRWVRQASSPEHGFTTVGLSIHHSEGGIAETLDLRSAVHGRPQVWTAVDGPSMVVHKVWTATIALSAGVTRLRGRLNAYFEKSVHTSMDGSPNLGCIEIHSDLMYRCLYKYTFVKIGMDVWTDF
jgi:hypothetical protein